jgi:hypothetical protein
VGLHYNLHEITGRTSHNNPFLGEIKSFGTFLKIRRAKMELLEIQKKNDKTVELE